MTLSGRSAMVAHLTWDEGVGSSSLPVQTKVYRVIIVGWWNWQTQGT